LSIETKRERFFDWVNETVETEEKAELRQEIRNLELENESLRSFEQENVEHMETREDFEKDLMLTNEAEVLGDMLAEEEVDTKRNGLVTEEPTESVDTQLEATDAAENVNEIENEEAESEVE